MIHSQSRSFTDPPGAGPATSTPSSSRSALCRASPPPLSAIPPEDCTTLCHGTSVCAGRTLSADLTESSQGESVGGRPDPPPVGQLRTSAHPTCLALRGKPARAAIRPAARGESGGGEVGRSLNSPLSHRKSTRSLEGYLERCRRRSRGSDPSPDGWTFSGRS